MENQACDEPEIDTATTEPGRLSRTNSGDGEHFYALKRVFPRGSISGAWRLVLRRQGQQIGRTFKDSAYGSAEAAFEQARDYRDAVMQALPPATLREKANCRRSDNASGVSGVYKAHDPQPRWVAYISSQEGTRTRSYSVSKYGEEAAKHLAIAKRQTWLEAAKNSLVGSFAGGVGKDLNAVRNAIISPWSNGQTEGQITRRKLIKRRMYGRAKLGLLQARSIGAS